MIDHLVANWWHHSGAVRLLPAKNWLVHFCDWGWGWQRYLPPRLCGDMATLTAIALDSSFNLLLMSRILVDKEENCLHHVIIRINHGYVCVVDINSLMCCLAAPGNHKGVDVNNTHLSMINPLNHSHFQSFVTRPSRVAVRQWAHRLWRFAVGALQMIGGNCGGNVALGDIVRPANL